MIINRIKDWNLINYDVIFFKDDFITSGRKYDKRNFFTFKLYPHIDIHVPQTAATTYK